jgi:hypothetical protein
VVVVGGNVVVPVVVPVVDGAPVVVGNTPVVVVIGRTVVPLVVGGAVDKDVLVLEGVVPAVVVVALTHAMRPIVT